MEIISFQEFWITVRPAIRLALCNVEFNTFIRTRIREVLHCETNQPRLDSYRWHLFFDETCKAYYGAYTAANQEVLPKERSCYA